MCVLLKADSKGKLEGEGKEKTVGTHQAAIIEQRASSRRRRRGEGERGRVRRRRGRRRHQVFF